jgi:hypothetical protein
MGELLGEVSVVADPYIFVRVGKGSKNRDSRYQRVINVWLQESLRGAADRLCRAEIVTLLCDGTKASAAATSFRMICDGDNE